MKKLTLEVNGKTKEAYVAYAKGVVWVHMDGETFTHETIRKNRRGGKGAAAHHPGEIAAPMPGKIIKVLVEKGAEAQEGQVLVVMEAMKMEYTLKAAGSGKVAEISVEPGQQVSLGQILVRLEGK